MSDVDIQKEIILLAFDTSTTLVGRIQLNNQ
jgi:hypothetical protein